LSDSLKQSQLRALKEAWQAGKVAPVIELARLFVKNYPKSAFGWFVYGNVLLDIAHYDDAKKALAKSIKYCSLNNIDRPYVSMGHLYRAKGNNRKAEKWYRKALEIRPKDQCNLVFIGAILARQGKFSEAKKFHRKAVKVDNSEADEAYYNLGLILRAEEKYTKARKAFKKAIKLDPKYREAKNALKDVNEVLKMKRKI
jgi:tetratricopeptide (TPR) repeat protein